MNQDTALWRFIAITDRMASLDLGHLSIVLARADPQPLALYVLTNSSWEHILPSLTTIATQACAYEIIYLDMYMEDAQVLPLFHDATKMARLRSLILNWRSTTEMEEDKNLYTNPQQPIDLSSSLSLHDLWLTCHDYPIYVLLPTPDSCGITRLHLDTELDFDASVGLIGSCPALELLDWRYDFYPLSAHRTGQRTFAIRELHFLKDLFLRNDAVECLRSILAPNLLKLVIITRCRNKVWHEDNRPFGDTAQFPNLRMLNVQNSFEYTDTDIIPFLLAHGDLEEVTLGVCLSEAFVACFCATTPTGLRLPKLRQVWMRPNRSGGTYEDKRLIRELLRLQSLRDPQCDFTFYIYTMTQYIHGLIMSTGRGRCAAYYCPRKVDDTWYWDALV